MMMTIQILKNINGETEMFEILMISGITLTMFWFAKYYEQIAELKMAKVLVRN